MADRFELVAAESHACQAGQLAEPQDLNKQALQRIEIGRAEIGLDSHLLWTGFTAQFWKIGQSWPWSYHSWCSARDGVPWPAAVAVVRVQLTDERESEQRFNAVVEVWRRALHEYCGHRHGP